MTFQCNSSHAFFFSSALTHGHFLHDPTRLRRIYHFISMTGCSRLSDHKVPWTRSLLQGTPGTRQLPSAHGGQGRECPNMSASEATKLLEKAEKKLNRYVLEATGLVFQSHIQQGKVGPRTLCRCTSSTVFSVAVGVCSETNTRTPLTCSRRLRTSSSSQSNGPRQGKHTAAYRTAT